MSSITRVPPERAESILRRLKYGARSYLQIAVAEGIHPNTAIDCLRLLHADGKIYVAQWLTHGAGRATPYYRAGNRPDAPRPAGRTSRERWQAWRELNPPAPAPRRDAPKPAPISLNWRAPAPR
jgi:predicted ArsR family transcriptional regulator